MTTRIKICGVNSPENARHVSECGVDAIGLNFYSKSPRFLPPSTAASIIRELPPFTATVGVFVNTPIRQATAVAFQLGLRAIQTVDDVPQSEDTFPFAWIPAFRVKEHSDLELIRQFVSKNKPSAVLIDSHVAGQMGGTGKTAPWHLLEGFNPGVPLILAGGLTPENVADAIRVVKPWGVDVASGVESSPGIKDLKKVKDFISAVRQS